MSPAHSRESALASLKQAVGLFVASARDVEILERLEREVEVALFEVERK